MLQAKVLADRLTALGLTAAGKQTRHLATMTEKLRIAYRKYRFVAHEKIVDFQQKLDAMRTKEEVSQYIFRRLSFVPLSEYQEIPPEAVLNALELAQLDGCFDTFEVAYIITEKREPDPIVFGLIMGCTDRFYIAQWDDDVKIEDILQADEGFIKPGFE